MNRLVALFASFLLVASVFGGCAQDPAQGEGSSASGSQQDGSSQETPAPMGAGEPSSASDSTDQGERITVADAALYRGEVRGLDEHGFYLVQVPGRDYGMGILRVSVGENTKMSFDRDTLQEGDYLEVYYGLVQETYPPQTEAIAVNRLPKAEMSVFNGQVVQVTAGEGEDTTLLLKRIDGEGVEEILFRVGQSTQVYASDIKEGDQLSILFSGAVALSLPAQATAWEVAPYAVTESEDYTQWIGSAKQ